MELKINTDGASRGNPGQASYGFVIKDDKGKLVYQEGKILGVTTNNVAEYTAVLKAFEYLQKNKIDLTEVKLIKVIADSQLIIEQLKGNFKIKNLRLKGIYSQIKVIEMEFLGKIFYQSVPREQNKEADRMANYALDHKIS